MEQDPEISVVVPTFNSAGTLQVLTERITEVAAGIGSYEIIFVDDGSVDKTWNKIRELAAGDRNIKAVKFTRNFGHHIAITAGLDAARASKWIAYLDSDLDEPPEAIAKLVSKLEEGFDVAIFRRGNLKRGWLDEFTSRLFYKVLSYISDSRLDRSVGNLRVLSRECFETLRSMREHNRFLGTMFEWMGYRTAYVDWPSEGMRNETAYTFRKRLRLAESAVISNSTVPLRFAAKIGFVLMAVSLLLALLLAVLRILNVIEIPGWTAIMVGLFLVSGMLMFQLGVIGMYLAAVVEGMRGRPLYVTSDRLNL